MTPQIWVAFIAAGTAVIASAVSLMTSLYSGRTAVKLQVELEKLRVADAARVQAQQFVDQEFTSTINGLALFLTRLQFLKDELATIINSPPQALKHQAVVIRLESVIRDLRTSFAEINPFLSGPARGAAHRASTLALEVYLHIGELVDDTGALTKELLQETRSRFSAIRMELTDCQNTLRDDRMDRFIARVQTHMLVTREQ